MLQHKQRAHSTAVGCLHGQGRHLASEKPSLNMSEELWNACSTDVLEQSSSIGTCACEIPQHGDYMVNLNVPKGGTHERSLYAGTVALTASYQGMLKEKQRSDPLMRGEHGQSGTRCMGLKTPCTIFRIARIAPPS